MGMVKVFSPAGWDWDRPVAQMVKVSSRGLVGNDRRDFIKLAGHAFADIIDGVKLGSGDVPAHLIALGADEKWGSNRNGDSWPEEMCKRDYDTFRKHARAYRSHANKDPKKSYGYVKAAAYNDAMRRIELLTIYNGTKEAAERNGGLVADKEIDKLSKGEDLPVSMAAKVPHDFCSSCGNKAHNRSEYCTEKTCVSPGGEKRGGCRHNLTKVSADGHILHVINPSADWFDISHVFRPADRIAYGNKADYLMKAASNEEFIPGAMLADMLGVTMPLSVLADSAEMRHDNPAINGHLKLAIAMAALEGGDNLLSPTAYRGVDPRVPAPLTADNFAVLGAPGTEKAAAALGAMADRGIILPLRDFAAWTGKSAFAADAAELLPNVYTHLVNAGNLADRVGACRWRPSVKTASLAQIALIANLRDDYGMTAEAAQDRAMLSSLRMLEAPDVRNDEWSGKKAADSGAAAALAEEYAMYKLAALFRAAESVTDFALTARLSLAQNRLQ